jgi:CspA family cold shock protein
MAYHRALSVHDSERTSTMASGTIKSLRENGFGFIVPDGAGGGRNTDLFFHRSAIIGTEFDSLQEGQRVTFDVEPDPRDSSRSRAVRVQLSDSEE